MERRGRAPDEAGAHALYRPRASERSALAAVEAGATAFSKSCYIGDNWRLSRLSRRLSRAFCQHDRVSAWASQGIMWR